MHCGPVVLTPPARVMIPPRSVVERERRVLRFFLSLISAHGYRYEDYDDDEVDDASYANEEQDAEAFLDLELEPAVIWKCEQTLMDALALDSFMLRSSVSR